MKHKGNASQAALKLILWTLVLLIAVSLGGLFAMILGSLIATAAFFLLGLWVVFSLFTLYFFRDPNPKVPQDPNAVVSPAHGKVDVIDETTEPEFIGGSCRRVSIFLSVIDVHVENAPVAGKIGFLLHTPGQFVSALKAEITIDTAIVSANC